MMAFHKVLVALALVCVSSSQIVSAATNKVVCYHGSWAATRYSNGKFAVEDIDPTLCSHLIYTFVGLNDDGSVRILDPWLEVNSGNLKRFNALKLKNPNLKTLIAIGGWNEGSLRYSNVAASATKRATLINSALNLVQTYGFDGFDLDWEYPAQRGGASIDKANYVTLLKEFRVVWDKHGLILTAAVAASSGSVDLSYDVPALSKYLDIINVMAYDLHGSWEGVAGQNAPLYPSSLDRTPASKELTVAASIQGWINRGADPQKIALGLAMYGRSFTLSNPASNKLGASISNVGAPGRYTQEGGMLGYNEICESLKEGGWTTVWDDEQKVPYSSKGNQWVGYDNARSIAIKANFAKSLNLAGVMIWTVETDDFRGICGPKYPLLNAIRDTLGSSNENAGSGDGSANGGGGNVKTTSTTTTTTTTTTTQKPVVAPTPTNLCSKPGYVRDPVKCNIFYYCMPVGSTYIPLQQQCSGDLVFDDVAIVCNYPSLVNC